MGFTPTNRPHRNRGVRAFSRSVHQDPFFHLEQEHRRLGLVVAQLSRRRDGRRALSQVILALLRLRCPPEERTTRSWYVPGAVSRLGARGLRRFWPQLWQEPSPCLKTLRRHLRKLEGGCCIVCSPGDWLPSRGLRGGRYPDTIHLVDREVDAEWWAASGRLLLQQHPEVRHDPRRWRRVIGDWRHRRPVQGHLFVEQLASSWSSEVPVRGDEEEAARRLATVVRQPAMLAEKTSALRALAGAGCMLHGPKRDDVLRDRPRLAGAIALLSVALRRPRPPRDRAAFLVFACGPKLSKDRQEALAKVVGAS